jgi:hypothetical protein
MNPEVKEQWLTALRSGEYKQGIGQLHWRHNNQSEFCCLGVLCDLAKQAGVVQEFDNPDDSSDPEKYGVSVSYEVEKSPSGWRKVTYLPYPVMVWAGLSNRNPEAGAVSLAGRNDNGETFEEIATAIERDL